jgi:hypothetical protein
MGTPTTNIDAGTIEVALPSAISSAVQIQPDTNTMVSQDETPASISNVPYDTKVNYVQLFSELYYIIL